MSVREAIDSPKEQGIDEAFPYTITTTPWGSSPTDVSVVVFERDRFSQASKGVDVTSTVMPTGTPSVAGDVITLPKLRDLTANKFYRVEVKFTADGGDWEAYFIVKAVQ